MTTIRRAVLAVIFMMLPFLQLHGQQFGEITGVATDATGAVIVGAAVTATNTATQQVRKATSNQAGVYSLPYLVPGAYNVSAEKAGFRVTTRTGVQVQVGDVIRADFSLQIGEVTQAVEVTGAAELLNTQSSAMGSVVGSRQILDLPLNGRDYLSLVALSTNASAESSPGVGTLQGGVRAQTNISVAGQRLEFNHYTLDGAENTDPNFNSYIIHPSVDAVQEFKVQTGIYSAEFGRGASQINVNTVSGTNTYHGAAFEFLRNAYVDAKIWNSVGAKAPFRRNNYGFTLSGPVAIPKVFNGRNRLFFMSNFEVLRDTTGSQPKASVAPDAMRNGDFSLTAGVQVIYDPATRVYPASGTPSATPFPGNKIPTSRFSAPAVVLQSANYYPRQTVPGNVLLNNFISSSTSQTQSTQFNQRMDWTESDSSTWFGRFSWGDDLSITGGTFYNSGNYVPTTVRQAVLGNTRILSPSVVNEARFAWNQFNNFEDGYYANKVNVQATLGIKGLVAIGGPITWGLPSVTFGGGLSGFGGGNGPYQTNDNTFQGLEGISVLKGSHSIKMGGEIRRMRYNNFGNSKSLGELTFDAGSTCNPASCTSATGYGYADFLLGLPSQVNRALAPANTMARASFYAGYIQDDWKVSRQVTLNVGFRYENVRPWVDKYSALINAQLFGWGVGFAPGNPNGTYLLPNNAAITPIITRPNCKNFYDGLNFRFADVQPVQCGDQMGPGLTDPSNRNFGPRFGFAYNPAVHWSIRAGYGIFYVQDVANGVYDMSRNTAGRDSIVVPNSARVTQLSDPWAAETASPACAGYDGTCLVRTQFNAYYQGNHTTYVEQYMFNIQRELTRDAVLEVGYLGNQGHHLLRFVLANQAVPKTGPTDNSSLASRRPWPGLGGIQELMDIGNSNYHSLSAKLTQRPAKGLTYTIAFTWMKSLDYGSAVRGGPSWPPDSYNLRALYGPSDFAVPLRFVASYVYALPFGPGRSMVNHGFASYIVGGWQLGGIFTKYSGLPIAGQYCALGDTATLGTLANSGNYTGVSPVPANRDMYHWWNAAAFNSTDPTLSWLPGNAGRNAMNGIGAATLDASLSRDIGVWESHKVNIRFEAFNATNHPNYGTPSIDYQVPSTFGVINSARTMRQLQFSLKYSF